MRAEPGGGCGKSDGSGHRARRASRLSPRARCHCDALAAGRFLARSTVHVNGMERLPRNRGGISGQSGCRADGPYRKLRKRGQTSGRQHVPPARRQTLTAGTGTRTDANARSSRGTTAAGAVAGVRPRAAPRGDLDLCRCLSESGAAHSRVPAASLLHEAQHREDGGDTNHHDEGTARDAASQSRGGRRDRGPDPPNRNESQNRPLATHPRNEQLLQPIVDRGAHANTHRARIRSGSVPSRPCKAPPTNRAQGGADGDRL